MIHGNEKHQELFYELLVVGKPNINSQKSEYQLTKSQKAAHRLYGFHACAEVFHVSEK